MSNGTGVRRSIPGRVLARCGAAVAALQFVPGAAAHAGSAHAGTPHWALLAVAVVGVGALAVVGVGALAVSIRLGRDRWADYPRRAVAGMLVGAALVVVGTAGLVEMQIEPLATNPTPVPRT